MELVDSLQDLAHQLLECLYGEASVWRRSTMADTSAIALAPLQKQHRLPLQRPFIGLDLGGDWLTGGREAAALHCMPETGGLRRRPGWPGKSRIDAGDPNPRWG
jgi:hypothetical protein